MATTLYFKSSSSTVSDWNSGATHTPLSGADMLYDCWEIETSIGSSPTSINGIPTVAGPTNGVEVNQGAGPGLCFISHPLAADVTISGSITWNLWALESGMNANVAINGIIEVIDGATGAITLIDKTARTTEMAFSGGLAANNFAETPAAGVACKRGDRLRVRIFGDDAGTMATGFTFDFGYGGGAGDSDSFITLTENLTFEGTPSGTTIYPTNTASAVSTANEDLEAWTSRGGSATLNQTVTVAGPGAPIQVSSGNLIDWFTRPLQAFTLGGAVLCQLRGARSSGGYDGVFRVEIARVDGDGTNPTVWAAGNCHQAYSFTTESAGADFRVSGDDLAISDGQRLRLRLYVDDFALPMLDGMLNFYYNGPTPGASGDSYFIFPQTLTEFDPPDPALSVLMIGSKL